jgi:hypothetical protein
MTEEPLFSEIKNLFYSCFDHPWLINIVEENREQPPEIGTIRAFLSLQSGNSDIEYHLVLTGLRALRDFIRIMKSSVMPNANFNLNFYEGGKIRNRELMLLKKCIIYTLPENIKKLDVLTIEFEKSLMRKSLLN